MRRTERIRGCILGGAIGDALGAAIEFESIEAIRARYGAAGVTDLVPAYGRAGAITDDTQMTLFTMSGVLAAHHRSVHYGLVHIPTMVDVAYAAWLRTQGERSPRWPDAAAVGPLADRPELNHRRAPGNTCLAALREERMGTVPDPINQSKGCGGVMRIAPVGLASVHDHFDVGCELAAITHGHPSGYAAAGALAEIIAALYDGAPLVAALDRAEARLCDRPRLWEVLGGLRAARALAASGAEPSPETVSTLGAGWVGEEALAIAVYCALVADGFEHGVLLAVNHSGDSDSTGAICGNILGTLLGEQALPSRWLDRLELREAIERLCDQFAESFVVD